MSTKEEVLHILQENGTSFLSGQQIADRLFLTRAAVWKAIKALQKDGCHIEAVTNRGYRLLVDPVRPNLNQIRQLSTLPKDFEILYFDSIPSSNDQAKLLAANNSQKDLIVIAGSQTKGKGRRGRIFYSPDKTGLYISFLLHPQMSFSQAVRLTCMMAEALCRAIEEVTGLQPDIKWVNDIFYNGKKIAGILTEGESSLEDGSLSYVVIGVGLNLYPPYEGFPESLKNVAGSLLNSAYDPNVRDSLYASLIKHFFSLYEDPNFSAFIDGYRSRSMLIGRYVKLLQPDKERRKGGYDYALVTGIDENCQLCVKYEDGKEATLSSGEISVIRY